MTIIPKVSVIIPTYNRAHVIASTIDNVLEQTYRNVEIIIVDDGSTDETQASLKKFGKIIRLITQSNAGPAIARNRGAAAATGDIIAFQDSDDLWELNKLERQVDVLERAGQNVPCCLSNAVMRIVAGKRLTSFDISLIRPPYDVGLCTNVPEILATRFVLFNQTAAIRTRVFRQLGGFDESLKYLEDYDLPMRLSFEGPWAFIKEPLVLYKEGSSESFSQKALKEPLVLKDCEVRIFENALARAEGKPGASRLRALLNRRLRQFNRGITSIKLKNKNSWTSFLWGRSFELAGHYSEALFRRSPRYPQVAMVPLLDERLNLTHDLIAGPHFEDDCKFAKPKA